jgi:hypothetical protein
MISADDNLSVASRMADANLADATRQVHDVSPFDSGTSAATTDPSVLGGAAHLDPGLETGQGDHSATADPNLDGDSHGWG